MRKVSGIALIALALVVIIVPLFTDCQSQGRSLTTSTGSIIPMKCHWTAIAEMALGIPLLLLGILYLVNKTNETLRSLSLVSLALGVLVILLPTALIGVCAKNEMICNMIMRPVLILTGTLVVADSLTMLIKYRHVAPAAA